MHNSPKPKQSQMGVCANRTGPSEYPVTSSRILQRPTQLAFRAYMMWVGATSEWVTRRATALKGTWKTDVRPPLIPFSLERQLLVVPADWSAIKLGLPAHPQRTCKEQTLTRARPGRAVSTWKTRTTTQTCILLGALMPAETCTELVRNG